MDKVYKMNEVHKGDEVQMRNLAEVRNTNRQEERTGTGRKTKRSRLWFWLVLLIFGSLGIAAVCKLSLKMLFAEEVLVFIAAALLPFCQGRECLWVVLLTVFVWMPWDVIMALKYAAVSFSHYPGWMFLIFLFQMAGMLMCAEVIGFGLIARAIWKYQKKMEV